MNASWWSPLTRNQVALMERDNSPTRLSPDLRSLASSPRTSGRTWTDSGAEPFRFAKPAKHAMQHKLLHEHAGRRT